MIHPAGMSVQVAQAFGNCPQFIQQRQLTAVRGAVAGEAAAVRSTALAARWFPLPIPALLPAAYRSKGANLPLTCPIAAAGPAL